MGCFLWKMNDQFYEIYGLRIMIALRRIIHEVDRYSRYLLKEHQITGPQLICLYSIVRDGSSMPSELSRKLKMRGSTVNGILDRLEQNGYIKRERSHPDRRKVLLIPTEKGLETMRSAPLPLQDRLVKEIKNLPELEQAAIAISLERVADLMDLEDYEIKSKVVLDTTLSESV